MTAQIERTGNVLYSGPRVAVVDDDVILLELMREVLAEPGWGTLGVRDASSALATVSNEQPDAIILDIRLGTAESGWTILRQLKENPLTCSIPVIVWSGDVRLLEDRHDWLEQYSVPTLPKPFEIEELYRLLDAVLERVRREEGLPRAIVSA